MHVREVTLKHTSVDCEAINRHGGGHVSNVHELLFTQASGWTGHALRLAVQCEEICTPSHFHLSQ